MCLILLAIKTHPYYDLIFLANRDEFYDRPSAPACFWNDSRNLLAGRDLREGGTWLGITKNGKIAAVTNYRSPKSNNPKAPSRGRLVTDFLQNRENADLFLMNVMRRADHYNGFNLLLGERDRIYWYSNRGDGEQFLAPGIYGLSNHLLDSPWPKIIRGKAFLRHLILAGNELSPEDIFQFLRDEHIPDDKDLPDTGVGLERERMLSPIFISSPDYGTRSSTLLFIDKRNRVTFIERTYIPNLHDSSTVRYEFIIEE